MSAYYADPKTLPISSWLDRSQEEAPRSPMRRSVTSNNIPNTTQPTPRSIHSRRIEFSPVHSRPSSSTQRKARKHRKRTRKLRR